MHVPINTRHIRLNLQINHPREWNTGSLLMP
uniref:Uncharacterized protein n=1 Tax=Arundo donax TaxID=35708 RepID=A0A0A9FAK2_ARUDO